MKPEALKPGDTIGILGAGQLGRMMALAAAQFGLKTHIFGPDGGEPAFQVCAAGTVAAYEDEKALAQFADAVDVVTYEFENVPAATAAFLAARRPVRPGPFALQTTQDRLVEKDFLNGAGAPTAPYAAVSDEASALEAASRLGLPAILKTRRFGYDGKGQILLRAGEDAAQAFRALGGAACILEGFVPFTKEISVVGARGLDGSFVAYDVCENEHEHHILSLTRVPARIGAQTAAAALALTRKIADALDYVGVIAVEMFLVEEGGERLVVNEIAPRVHNSGHWTLGGAQVSQFEQHVRAIAGWPLGGPRRLGRIEMRNLIGDQCEAWPAILAEPEARLTLYGKAEARKGRKMGHVTRIFPENE
ncbi:MAG: 5-(carboxyamino)imidazole ribonucleotide synthase [Hyphomicrobiales bacterium]|nr:5-(carboxyamino)imidazole ribonucleotide synthase [Hyphomicrobiales bacterium]